MTSKLTKEQAEDTIEGLEGLISRGIQSVYLNIAISGMRQLLAAMDGEPVAYTDGRNLGYIDRGRETAYLWGKQNTEVGDIALYRHAQPAPDREQIRNEHAEWSQSTFGNVGPIGPLKHLSKEALEAAADPSDLSEWADMQFLLWDAQRRAGITDEQITQAMIEKLAVNKQREWPAPKDGEPRLHFKEQLSPVIPDRWIPVSERMPEERETVVLVADERGIVWCAEIQDGEIYPDEFPGTRGFGCAEATHWMPLPAAPKQEDI